MQDIDRNSPGFKQLWKLIFAWSEASDLGEPFASKAANLIEEHTVNMLRAHLGPPALYQYRPRVGSQRRWMETTPDHVERIINAEPGSLSAMLEARILYLGPTQKER